MAKRLQHKNTLRGTVAFDDGTPQAVKNEFARRLQAAMIEKNWNQSELARRATKNLPDPFKGQTQGHKVGRDQISHYIRGKFIPRDMILAAIAKALGCKPHDLVPVNNMPSTAHPPAMSMRSLGDDKVALAINRVTSQAVATKIIGLLTQEDAR